MPLDNANLPATLRSLPDIVAEYDEKVDGITDTIRAMSDAITAAEMSAIVGGTYVESIWGRSSPGLYDRTLSANLLKSAWRHVYNGLQLDRIAPASDRSQFETAFANPPPFTLDNIRATFGKYLTNPRQHILRGLAECFSQLDPAFKSHDRMKIGVKGLPKRIILSSVDDYSSGYGNKRLTDTINAIRVFEGKSHVEHAELREMLLAARNGDGVLDGLTLRRFKNGNAHLFFDAPTMLAVNRALVEYYGEVLPDCPEGEQKKAPGTAVSKDLQFYRTPDAAADLLMDQVYLRSGMRVLEPSCGDGALLDALSRRTCKDRRVSIAAQGIEYDPIRAAEARAKGYQVQIANFLQVTPSPVFDVVIMNPPFYGKHYQKHVNHARKFLTPGGTVYAILPITAATDHGFVDLPEGYRGYDKWRDLPVGSFSESGTNINTGIAKFHAYKEDTA